MVIPYKLHNDNVRPSESESFAFPAYRSPEWLERHRLMPAMRGCLSNVAIEPKSLLNYSHVKAYNIKAEKVRAEIRNALFRQALFKIQNIEVVASNKCKSDRLLLEIIKKDRSWIALGVLGKRPLLSEELWRIDRCGSVQQYRVRYFHEGDDGFTCKVYPTSVGNFLNYIRYYLSI